MNNICINLGVHVLNWLVLEEAKHHFNHIIVSTSSCMMLMATLSIVVEITAAFGLIESAKDCSKKSESHHMKRYDAVTLSLSKCTLFSLYLNSMVILSDCRFVQSKQRDFHGLLSSDIPAG